MATKYWIKLYHEILDDPKMGRLPDSVWRRCIEIFLLAGETGEDGTLPPVGHMAWRLRLSDDEMRSDLEQLESVSIVKQIGGLWIVTAFERRQKKMTKAEYMRRLRDERAGMLPESDESSYQTVTDGNAEEDSDTEEETEANQAAAVFSLFENEIGGLTPLISDDLGDLIDEFNPLWVMDAIKETSRSGAKSIKYTRAILERWKREGKSSKPAPSGNGRIHEPDEAGAAFEVAWNCAGRGRLDTEDETIKQAARTFGFARLRQWDVNFKSTAQKEFIGIYNDIKRKTTTAA